MSKTLHPTAAPEKGGVQCATLDEIRSQPRCWAECLAHLEADPVLADIRKQVTSRTEWLFIGCGSSYYIALSAAATFLQLTGMRARAVPASELLLYPEMVLAGSEHLMPVLISRSGSTSEVLQAAEYLEKERKIRCISLTCTLGKPLEDLTTFTLKTLPAEEVSTVMTRSFTSMLLALQFLVAYVGENREFRDELQKLPEISSPFITAVEHKIKELVGLHDFANYVFLGQGPFFGLASESTLKVIETSCSFAQCFHTLEFRHGPKSIVSRRTLLSFLLSRPGRGAEAKVAREVKGLGGVTLAIVNAPGNKIAESTDILIEVPGHLSELAQLVMYCFPGQLLGVYTAFKKGLNPDQPMHLSPVVILEGKARESRS